MTPHYQDDWLTVYLGDCREVLSQLPAESVHCVVTSPPYWGLRDYGTATWLGGDEGCQHVKADAVLAGTSTLGIPADGGSRRIATGNATTVHKEVYRHTCGKCGATRQDRQLGLEPTPEEYVANMVAVFREVRRVLRRDGTVWLNVGDSYAGSGPNTNANFNERYGRPVGQRKQEIAKTDVRSYVGGGLKPKDLVGIPWRLAFALQADGWYLRSDIVWSKPNPMPESVTDRPTKAHEYVFLLTRSARYYYDADAVREPHARIWDESNGGSLVGGDRLTKAGRNDGQRASLPLPNPAGRNLRSVWTIATQPYPGAHFATFPQALVEPCVKAGTSERGVCPECGSPWRRVVRVIAADGRSVEKPASQRFAVSDGRPSWNAPEGLLVREDAGWQSTCAHDAEPVPATVLDPFAGSGTTGLVANRLSRRAILIDLSGDYLGQAMERNRQMPMGLAS